MNRRDFQELARLRLQEAAALLDQAHYSGAYYLSGYAVECALKACIAKQTKRYDFPNKETVNKSYEHDPEKLVSVAGLQALLKDEIRRDRDFEIKWSVVKDWSEKSRYQTHDEKAARDLYSAIADRRHGVLRWIRRHW